MVPHHFVVKDNLDLLALDGNAPEEFSGSGVGGPHHRLVDVGDMTSIVVKSDNMAERVQNDRHRVMTHVPVIDNRAEADARRDMLQIIEQCGDIEGGDEKGKRASLWYTVGGVKDSVEVAPHLKVSEPVVV